MLKLANRSRDNYNFLAAPRRHHHFFVENFSLSAINITSIHVIGWVLPLCRETWSQMRWSNFEKVYFLRLTANYMLWRLSGLTFFARTGSFFWKRMHWLNQPKNCFNEVPHCPSSRKTHPAGQTLLGDNDSSRWNHAFTQDHTMKTKSEQVGCQSTWVFCTCIQYDPISTAQQNAKAFISMNIMLLHFVCPSEGYYYYYHIFFYYAYFHYALVVPVLTKTETKLKPHHVV